MSGVPYRVPEGTDVEGYAIAEHLGSGAWGSVYAATAPDGAAVAVKLIPPTSVDPAMADRTSQEVALAERRLDGLVPLLEVLRLPDGALGLVMPRAESNLEALIAAAGDGHAIDDADARLTALWDTLERVHAAGWVHADVKASNVLVMPDGAVLLADFGTAAELDGTHAYVPPLGPPDTMPPEWWSDRAGVQGARARPARDLWALGVLAHRVLTGGRHPFEGQTARARAHAAQEYASGNATLRLDDAVPERWRASIAGLLAVDPAARHDALRPGRITGSGHLIRRRAVAAVAAAAAVVAVLLVVLLGGGGHPTHHPRAEPANGGELAASAPVPDRYRKLIVAAAHNCPAAQLTPSLVAGILDVESGFDPRMRRPADHEYGIAGWTPSVFDDWKQDVDGGGASVMSPADSIIAVGSYLCASLQLIKRVPGDRGPLLAAVYGYGTDAVTRAGGVPPRARPFVAKVMARARTWAVR